MDRRIGPLALGLCALGLGGCAQMPLSMPSALPSGEHGALMFWDKAVQAGNTERNAMWRSAQSPDKAWQIALLQSLPDYTRYDPAAARSGLKKILAENDWDDVAAVARIRLADLKSDRVCEERVAEFERRLNEVIAIEKRLDEHGR
jgi:ABC-type branched-subunit amino acid transport system substrate-binding protein